MPSRQERLQLLGDHAKALQIGGKIGGEYEVKSLPFLEVLTERIQNIKKPDKFFFSGLELSDLLNGLAIQELDKKHSIPVGETTHENGFLVAHYGREPGSERPFIKFMIYDYLRLFADGQDLFARDLRQKDFFEQLEEEVKIKILNWTSMAITRKIEAEK